MFKRLLDAFGKRKFDKKEEVAPAPLLKVDSAFQTNDEFESDGAGSLTTIAAHDKWEEIQERTTPDMTPKEYNQLLIDVYGGYDNRTFDWEERETKVIRTFSPITEDSSIFRADKQ
jgi:hypothetical protein